MLEPGRVHYQEGGEEQHLTLVPGLGRKSRVQSAVEEGSQSWSSSSIISVSIVVVLCIASDKYII